MPFTPPGRKTPLPATLTPPKPADESPAILRIRTTSLPSPDSEPSTPELPPPAKSAVVRPTSPPPSAQSTGIQDAYKRLAHAAVDLNAASDELGKPIQVCETVLKTLNLGIAAWVEISSGGDAGGEQWWDRSVGYAQFKDRWGIALRSRNGSYSFPDHDSEERWPFNEAPRWMRIEGIGKLDELLDALLKRAEETTKKIRAKVEQANELARAISAVADETTARREGR